MKDFVSPRQEKKAERAGEAARRAAARRGQAAAGGGKPAAAEAAGRKAEGAPAETVLFLLAGIAGLLSLFLRIDGVEFRAAYPILAAAVTAAVLFAPYAARLRFRWIFVLGTVLALAFIGYRNSETLLTQAGEFGAVFLPVQAVPEQSAGTADITALASYFAACMTLLIFVLEYLCRGNIVIYVLINLLLIMAPTVSVQFSVFDVILLGAFQIAYFSIQSAVSADKGTIRRAAATALICGVLALFVGSAAAAAADEGLYGIYDYVDMKVNERELSKRDAEVDTASDGIIGRGNNHRGSDVNMYVTIRDHDLSNLAQSYQTPYKESVLTEPIYLIGFRGGIYSGGQFLSWWSSMSEVRNDSNNEYNRLYGIATYISGDDLEDDLFSYGVYKAVSISTYLEDFGPVRDENGDVIFDPGDYRDIPFREIRIDSAEGKVINPYKTYYCGPLFNWDNHAAASGSYTFDFYDKSRITIPWDYIDSLVYGSDGQLSLTPEGVPETTSSPGSGSFGDDLSVYEREIVPLYAEVDKTAIPRMAKLVEQNPLTDIDDITAFIIYTLQSNCEYTLTPGQAPANKDITEYFLFERKAGYCEQFAAAATLLYRLYGVPARYVSGYMIDPTEFKSTRDIAGYTIMELGKTAAVSGDMAHAWTEIWMGKDTGWVRVEVTPASDGSMVSPYEGMSESRLSEIMDEHGWDPEVPSIPEGFGQNTSDTGTSRGIFGGLSLSDALPEASVLYPALLISLVCILFCIAHDASDARLKIGPRRAYLAALRLVGGRGKSIARSRAANTDTRAAAEAGKQETADAGVQALLGSRGSGDAEAFAAAGLTRGEAARFVLLCEKDAFAREGISEGERQACRETYLKMREAVFKKANPIDKFLMLFRI